MPLQNRVLPTGDIVADPARGTLTGNRGILHRTDQTLGPSRWTHHAWICCTLDWQGRKRQVMTGRNWTELFFLDEAVAFAAGHRPCGYCRRAAYRRFCTAWEQAMGHQAKALEMDKVLHAARIIKGTRQQRTYQTDPAHLVDGTFVRWQDHPHLVVHGALRPYQRDSYGPRMPMPDQPLCTLTPAPLVKILQAGYAPLLHLSATSR